MTQHVVIHSFHPFLLFEVLHVGHSIHSYVLALIDAATVPVLTDIATDAG